MDTTLRAARSGAAMAAAAAISALLAGCGGNGSPGPGPEPIDTGSPTSVVPPTALTPSPGGVTTLGESSAPPTASVPAMSRSTPSASAAITKERAGKIVTDKYGGTVINVEPDTHQGEKTWEVEVKDSSKGRIEVDVSQSSGEMVSFEQD